MIVFYKAEKQFCLAVFECREMHPKLVAPQWMNCQTDQEMSQNVSNFCENRDLVSFGQIPHAEELMSYKYIIITGIEYWSLNCEIMASTRA